MFTHVVSHSTRLANWYISLFTVLALILLVIPLLQSLFLTYSSGRPTLPTSSLPSQPRRVVKRRHLIALVPYCLFIYCFTLIPVPSTSTPNTPREAVWAAMTLSRLVVAGVIILGLLSGFGAVRNAWKMLANVSIATWNWCVPKSFSATLPSNNWSY